MSDVMLRLVGCLTSCQKISLVAPTFLLQVLKMKQVPLSLSALTICFVVPGFPNPDSVIFLFSFFFFPFLVY